MMNIPHPPKRVLHLDIANCFDRMTFDFLEELSLRWYDFSQRGLEVWFAGGGVGSY